MKKQLLIILMMLLPMVASAHDIEVKNADGKTIYYNYINNGTELEVTYRGISTDSYKNEYTGKVVIPDEVAYMNRTRKVTSIGSYAFYECSGLTSVIIGNSVTSIGEEAFSCCEALTSIIIGNSVTSIGEEAFSCCKYLYSVIIGNSVTSIGNKAFRNCYRLISITIPNSVTSIGDGAFTQCDKLTNVTIGNSVTNIGIGAFRDCKNLEKVIVSDIAAWCSIKFHAYDANPLHEANHLYSDENTEIKDLVIPNSVTSIGNYAFQSCYGLISVTIPNSVTSIGSRAFNWCRGLTSINIPNSVTSIGSSAFESCSGLTSVTISNSVTSIGVGAFAYCSGLTSVTIPNSVTSIGESAFSGCSALKSVTIPNSVTSIGESAFSGSNLRSVTIPNSVTSIGQKAFNDCNILNVVSLIDNPFRIDESTFTRDTYYNAMLYVPVGTIDKYKATDSWKKFVFIEEGTGGGDTPPTPPTPQKCEKPNIVYQNGKLTFVSSTEGATCQYSITDSDIKTGSGGEVQLTATYNIGVYATKTGYENSETATAALCWIDASPKTEGITNGIANVPAKAVLIQTAGGEINVQGCEDGERVSVYSINGSQVGAAISQNGAATINTTLQQGSVAFVKIGQKSVKVMMK